MSILVSDIIRMAFTKVGVSIPSLPDQASALDTYNDIISTIGADFLAPHIIRENFTLLPGTSNYTMGPAGTFDTTRPLLIRDCFLRTADGMDRPLNILSPAEYNEIAFKAQPGIPAHVYFIPESPRARLIFDPAPDSNYSVFIDSEKNPLSAATSTEPVNLPIEYIPYLVYSLTMKLAEDRKITLSDTVRAFAQRYKDMIGRLRAVARRTPPAKFDLPRENRYG